MILQSAWRQAAERSIGWKALLPVRVVHTILTFLFQRVTQPRDASMHAEAEALLAESRVGRAAQATVVMLRLAISNSGATRYLRRAGSSLGVVTSEQRVRGVAGVTLVAAATALALRQVSTVYQPLTWVVPLAIALCAVVAWMCAPAVAAALSGAKH